ncbi:MAG TPA: ABC transporter permease [Rectinema sp.]|nr:ABC transporter permease [Rectinema sp.]HQG15628.1 ABC transporter permease [Rectinema sp.]
MISARLAWRNICLHRKKSLIIGLIMGFGILILFVGNSLIDTTISGLRRMFVEGYTGDLMVTGPTEFSTTVLGETAGSEEVLPHIAQIKKYEDFLEARQDVASILPILSGQVSFGIGEEELGSGYCFGVNIFDYRAFFPDNLTLVSGEWPEESDEPWVLLSEPTYALLQQSSDIEVKPGTKIIMTALANSAGTVIREVSVKGIIKFNQSNAQLSGITLVDADTMRDLLGFASLRDGAPQLSEHEAAFLTDFDPDSLFDNLFASQTITTEGEGQSELGLEPSKLDVSEDPGQEISQASSTTTVIAEIVPAWQFLLIRAKNGSNTSKLLDDLEAFSEELGDGDRVQDWIAGAGKVARTAVTIRLVFDLLVAVIAVVVVMIMMNVLVISVNERLHEIGTLRAIGAKRHVVRSMILYETTFMVLIAGAVGLILGYILLLIMGKVGIRAPNLFFEALFGGEILRPLISIGAAGRAFFWVLAMALVASWYPTRVAVRIEPVVAMRGD